MSGTLRLLPPRALAVSLLLQVPGVLAAWPPELSWRRVLAGVTVLLCGCGLNVWAVWVFRRGEAGVCPFSAVERVVDGGPYRFSRNPMYLGLVLISAAFVLLAGPLWNAGFAAALGVWLHLRFVLPEEEFLRERLGAAYLEYASRRARWLGL